MLLCLTKIIAIVLLLLLYNSFTIKEGFSQKELKVNATELFTNKHLFKPNVKYSKIKQALPWVDPVVYDDIYKLALKETLSISNLENTLYNGIK